MFLIAGYLIREILPTDNQAIKRVIKQVLIEHGANSDGFAWSDPELNDMYASFQAGNAIYYVVTSGNKVFGGGGIAQLKGSDSLYCELQKMYFLPEVRGKGVGRELIGHLLAFAKKYYTYCYLETLFSMQQANHLYKEFGFEKLSDPMGQTGHTSCNAWYLKKLGTN